MKFPSIELLISSLLKTLKRFPLAMLVSVIATILGLILVEYQSGSQDNTIAKILMTCSLAMPLFFSFHAMWEREKKRESLILLGVGVLMLGIFYMGIVAGSHKNDISHIWAYRFFMWNGAFHLLAAFSTFYWASEMNGFWQWNKNLFLSFLLASLYSMVLYAGLSLALLAITQLFGVTLNEKIYGDLWVIIGLFFQPLIFLGSIPSPISELQEDESYPTGLRVFTQYILLPLVAIYFVILYLYMGKILVQWNLPKGWVSYLIIGFSVSGILSLLLLHPLTEKEEYKWVRWVNKLYYLLLIPLFILMLVSIGVRIQSYGITPNRYIVLILALWLGVLALYFSFSPKKNIILIPLSLAVIAVLCSFGPWGIFGASVNSQTKQLQAVLSKHHLFEKGKFAAAPKNQDVKMTSKEEGQIRSCVDLLNHLNYGDNLREWIPKEWEKDSLIDEYNMVNTYKLSEKLGIEVSDRGYNDPSAVKSIYFNSGDFNLLKGIKVTGYSNINQINACADDSSMCYENANNQLKANIRNNYLIFSLEGTSKKDSISLEPILAYGKTFDLENQENFNNSDLKAEKMQLEKVGKAKVLISQFVLQYSPKTKAVELEKVDGYILYND